MSDLSELLEQNENWAERVREAQPAFFERLAAGQNPQALWIGCADSRVPPTRLLDASPGDLFVHRNIANLVHLNDLSLLSVIAYAVEVLGVPDIIVCGHYGCGGVKAAMEPADHGLVDHWLHSVQGLYAQHRAAIDALSDEQARVDRLCELNVAEQVRRVSQVPSVRRAWRQGRALAIHGWIFGLADGRLKDLGLSREGPLPEDEAFALQPAEPVSTS